MDKSNSMDTPTFNRLKSDLSILSSGQWKDCDVCPNPGFSEMGDDQLAETLEQIRPILVGYGSIEWDNIVNAFLYMKADQRIFDAIAERFPGMDRALEEGENREESLYEGESLDKIFNIFHRQLKNGGVQEKKKPEPSEVLKDVAKAVSTAQKLLKMAEMSIQNVRIEETRKRKPEARRYYDDYGNPCACLGEQRVKQHIRNAIYGADKMMDTLQTITTDKDGTWIKHPYYQQSNHWMSGNTTFDRSYEKPTESRARRAFTNIPKVIGKAEQFLNNTRADEQEESDDL